MESKQIKGGKEKRRSELKKKKTKQMPIHKQMTKSTNQQTNVNRNNFQRLGKCVISDIISIALCCFKIN